ncbi:flavin reductase family protein [Selenomonas sp. TAMA-11512]|uniref:flavin reductase family protein n=1 Tax=Selenomonas sp. TAMA-11512 TaxID=3095337 RepID=UPI003092DC9B|nr:flavin reductase family protein [Selenomonas sp. TAMA-11512]
MKEFNAIERIGDIMQAVQKGVLLTTKSGDTVNTMTISWGAAGIEWGKPVFIAFLREGRFTRTLLEKNQEFTVNMAMDPAQAKTLMQAGRSSGRDGSKIEKLGLTLADAQEISVPAIREFPMTLECKVVSRVMQGEDTYTEHGKGFLKTMYPQDVPSTEYGANRDFHVIYVAEIVKAYVIE